MMSEVVFDVVKYLTEQKSNGQSIEVFVADRKDFRIFTVYLTADDEFQKSYSIGYEKLACTNDIKKTVDAILKDFIATHKEHLKLN